MELTKIGYVQLATYALSLISPQHLLIHVPALQILNDFDLKWIFTSSRDNSDTASTEAYLQTKFKSQTLANAITIYS